MKQGLERILTLTFGEGGNEINHLGVGWSGNELGNRWMTGDISALWLEHPGADGDLILELDIGIVRIPAEGARQSMTLDVRDVRVAYIEVTQDGPVGFHIPAKILRGPGPVRLLFGHPHCRRPVDHGHSADDRELSFWIRSLSLFRVLDRPAAKTAPRLPLNRTIAQFESLGDNCEFGLLQRQLKAEPLGLFRFSFIESRD